MKMRCICDICTCGRHRCPHYPQGGIQAPQGPCAFSEYASTYVQHPTEPRGPNYRPQDQPVASGAALDDKTTHRLDYIQHPLGEKYVRPEQSYQKPEGSLDTLTNYSKDFQPPADVYTFEKPLDPARSMRQKEVPLTSGKFEGEPTYQADYRKWEAAQRSILKPGSTYVPSTTPFDADSHYKTDFVPKQGAPRESMRPNHTDHRSDQPFQDATESKDRFVQHPLQARDPKKNLITYEPSKDPLDDMTTHRKDYTPKEAQRAQAYRPNANPYQSTEPLDQNTTHKTDYVQWQVEQRAAREPEAYQKPVGSQDFNTTHLTDYSVKPLERQLVRRPQETKLITGKFDDATHYKSDYQQWAQGERAARPQQPTYQPNEAPFEGLATYQRDYVPKTVDPAKSMRPQETSHRNDAPLDGATEYNKEFGPKRIPPCPAHFIQNGHDIGFEYHTQDDQGHHWYNLTSNEAFEKFKNEKMYGELVK